MAKKETPLHFLQQFIPEGSYDLLTPFFDTYTIHLTLTRERKTVLGDYRCPSSTKPFHRISVNINLNRYSFLITLLHEIAHLATWLQHKNAVAPHGDEWKKHFQQIILPFLGKQLFPATVEAALLAYLYNPAASTCTDPVLFKALYEFDQPKEGYKLVDDITIGHQFITENGKVFEKLKQQRSRCRCREIKTGKMYLFPGIVEVKEVD
jgi:hypothetical protein